MFWVIFRVDIVKLFPRVSVELLEIGQRRRSELSTNRFSRADFRWPTAQSRYMLGEKYIDEWPDRRPLQNRSNYAFKIVIQGGVAPHGAVHDKLRDCRKTQHPLNDQLPC